MANEVPELHLKAIIFTVDILHAKWYHVKTLSMKLYWPTYHCDT